MYVYARLRTRAHKSAAKLQKKIDRTRAHKSAAKLQKKIDIHNSVCHFSAIFLDFLPVLWDLSSDHGYRFGM